MNWAKFSRGINDVIDTGLLRTRELTVMAGVLKHLISAMDVDFDKETAEELGSIVANLQRGIDSDKKETASIWQRIKTEEGPDKTIICATKHMGNDALRVLIAEAYMTLECRAGKNKQECAVGCGSG